MDPPGMMVQT